MENSAHLENFTYFFPFIVQSLLVKKMQIWVSRFW